MLFEAALDAADRAFLAEVRAFLDSELDASVVEPEDALRSQVCDHPRQEAWIERLRPRRWHVGFWPVEHGGAGLGQVQNYLLLYEQGRRGAPLLSPLSITYVGPVVMQFGTPDQQQALLPAIVDGRDHWCQGFSEPGSGSDLGSVSTFAERRGDRYVVNGSKIWTTDAHHANKIFCLLRTRREQRKDALSFLLIDMDTPGVTVRPIRLMTGDHEFNQVFFDDVEVPAENLLGGEGGGWAVAKYLLERGADPAVRDSNDLTAWHKAVDLRNQPMADLLASYMTESQMSPTNQVRVYFDLDAPLAESASVVGYFSEWQSHLGVMTRREDDGWWYVELDLFPGSYGYKFDIGSSWILDPLNTNKYTDSSRNTENSLFHTSERLVHMRPEREPSSADNLVPVMFVYRGKGKKVSVAGEFNGWNTYGGRMTQKGDEVWYHQEHLAPGEYMYKIVVDGRWILDPDNRLTKYDGDIRNSLIKVEAEEDAP